MKKLLPTDYPLNLNVLGEYAPEYMYIEGDIVPRDCLAVAVVGTRTPTVDGKKKAHELSFNLARAGMTIVSGLARGIDTVAHKAALEAGGRTIAVLGSGLNVIYPPENKDLFKKISKQGAVLSEFPMDTKPLAKNFLARNRIVAALSLAVIVVEGRARSGTLSTARHAGELGREVFAVPGDTNAPMSAAPNYLIGEGVTPASSAQEILDYLESVYIQLAA